MKLFLSLLILMGAGLARAQDDTDVGDGDNPIIYHSKRVAKKPPEKPQARAKKAVSILREQYFTLNIGYHIWHEDVPAVSSGTPGDLPAQFQGFDVGGSYQKPFRSFRWLQYYGADISFGSAKGAGKGPVTDQVKDQPWYALTVKPGIVYRATAVSEIGIVVPLAFRKVTWKFDSTADLVVSDKAFSAGLEALFINRFNAYNSLVVTVTHQFMWNSTLWGIGYQYDFK